jgi:hypothetical protein
MSDLLVDLRDHLVAEGVVRRPRETEPAGAPPLWLPALGGRLRAPGEPTGATGDQAIEVGDTAVLGARLVTGIPSRRFEKFMRTRIVRIRLRVTQVTIAEALEERLIASLVDRRDWWMASRKVIESLEYLPMRPAGEDNAALDFLADYSFQVYTDQ